MGSKFKPIDWFLSIAPGQKPVQETTVDVLNAILSLQY
jgi:hypothetical protein